MSIIKLSASSISTFQTCRKRYEYEKLRHIKPVETADALVFGRLVHRGLEVVFRLISFEEYMIDTLKCHAKEWIEEQAYAIGGVSAEDVVKATVLVNAYIDTYTNGGDDDIRNWEIIDVENEFNAPITVPYSVDEIDYDTLLRHLSGEAQYYLHGYADAAARINGELYIVEHKTAGQVTDGYLDRVEIDWQLAIYADALSKVYGEPIVGAVYDIIKKPKHVMSIAETDEEYAKRKAEAAAKTKTGKTSIKQRQAETPEEFQRRLELAIDDNYFIRKVIKFDEETMAEFRKDLWAVAQEIGNCKTFYKCTCNCLKYGTCPFMKLCKAHGNLEGLESEYICDQESATDTEADAECPF